MDGACIPSSDFTSTTFTADWETQIWKSNDTRKLPCFFRFLHQPETSQWYEFESIDIWILCNKKAFKKLSSNMTLRYLPDIFICSCKKKLCVSVCLHTRNFDASWKLDNHPLLIKTFWGLQWILSKSATTKRQRFGRHFGELDIWSTVLPCEHRNSCCFVRPCVCRAKTETPSRQVRSGYHLMLKT